MQKRRPFWAPWLVAALVATSLSACASVGTNAPRGEATAYVYPDTGWQRVQPELVGWSAAGLERLRAELATLPTTGMMAVTGGRVFFEYGDLQRISYLASVRKSLLSMLFGIYVERGLIDLDKTLAQLDIDDVQGLTPAEKQARVRDLLSARSGVYHPASNAGDDLASAPPRGSQKPGEYYLYSNWDFNALGTIFEQMTGIDIYDAFAAEIAVPIGMRDWNRAIQTKAGNLTRSRHPAYHFNLSTRDMARVGYLMLRDGNWNGKQIVPRAWVRESTRPVTRRTEMNPEPRRQGVFGYGYLWWVFDDPRLPDEYQGAFVGLGAVGQQILVMPSLDLVVVHKTAPGNGSVTHDRFLQLVRAMLEARCGRQHC
jgi:CubicO group peptidase (beta-lactamase class C family)